MQKKATKEKYELQVLIDAFPFYIMVLDEEHKILMANKAIRGDLGLNPKQILGEYCPKAVHGLDEPYPGCPLEETLDKGHGVEREFHDPESNRWVSSAVYPIKQWTQENRKIFIHYIMDISERKQAEEEIKKNYDIQTVIDKVLYLSLEDISLDQLLKKTIDIILKIPWLTLEEKGCIFLVEDTPEMLVMKSQRKLSKTLRKKCAKIPFGKCVCGRAALTKKIQFSAHIDDHHEILYDGMEPHRHYCIPIIYNKKTLGVINLYLKPGHTRSRSEEVFLTAISNTLANVIIRKQADQALREREKELEKNNRDLQEMNSALNVLLKKRDDDKKELEDKVLFKVEKLLVPYLTELKNSKLDKKQEGNVRILESNLNNIISSFSRNLSLQYLSLTPLEIQIADLVKQGRSSKEIAGIFNLSIRTIEFHRQKIRTKLGIKQKNENLKTHLLSIQ